MIHVSDTKKAEISEEMVVAAQIYLGTCGAVEDPSLLLNRAFAVDMLETTLEECGEPYGRISEEMQDRMVEYFSRYRDVDEPMAITYSYFVEGLLSYALLGIDTNVIEDEHDSTVIRFPSNG